jgi:N-methylhydantoinase A/oxoprolinase/acetone carboxylase beta subunit
MLLGIDVGGTYTDAVLVDQNRIVRSAKSLTTHEDLMHGILGALEEVVDESNTDRIERIALSTTLVTNAIVERKTQPVGVVVMPGPGLNISSFLPRHSYIVTGSIDHRGREVASICRDEVENAVTSMRQLGIQYFAVIGKFSVRNPSQELLVAQWIKESYPEARYIALGHQLSSNLNFPRRIHTAYLNAATWQTYQYFVEAIEEAVKQRKLTAPVYILKADGGTLPLAASRRVPVETIFTGPAASILGVQALCEVEEPAAMLDIGGTTTDIALWRGGAPIFAPRGVRVGDHVTQVRSFLTRSIGIGGDSWIRFDRGELLIGPERKGLPAALGGQYPTITDALCVLGETTLGDKQLARQAIATLAEGTVEEIAQNVLDYAATRIAAAVQEIVAGWEQEPLYRVDDILQHSAFGLAHIVGVGGGAGGLAGKVAGKLGCKATIPLGGVVANAIGAAVARPTLTLTLRVDTEQKKMVFVEEGLRQSLQEKNVDETVVGAMAVERLREQAIGFGIVADVIDTLYIETFNVVRDYCTTGKIITTQVQLQPGILTKVVWTAGESSAQ